MTWIRRTFSLHCWTDRPWRCYPMLLLAWVQVWQIREQIQTNDYTMTTLSVASFIGATAALVGLHLRSQSLSRRVQGWGFLSLVWSLGCYLLLAVQSEGLIGLVRQTNIGVGLGEAVVLAAIHSTIVPPMVDRYKRWKTRRLARIILKEERGES